MVKKKSFKSSLLNAAKFTIGWPVSIIALFFIGKIILDNGKGVLPSLNNINISLLLLGIFFFILYYFIRAYVWKIILRLQGYDMPLKDVAYLWELSEFKRFAPGKIWAFIGRSSLFGKYNIPQKTIFKSMLIEIQFLLLANIIVSILAFSFIFKYIITLPSSNVISIAAILVILITTTLFIFSNKIFSVSRLLPSYSAKTKTSMLLISCLHALSFGLGTYFTAISIVYLDPQLFLQIVGFFVFSFLVSYISFITPMGIGVREGITTIGLAKIIPLAASGIVSIFARIVLIFSELCFLLFTYFWKNAKNKYIHFWENFISFHKQEAVLAFVIIAYIIYFASASFLRYDNFYTGRFDLGNMDQTVWNTINGRIFQTNDQSGAIISRLAFHADFILILLSPFYLIWSHPKMLLLIQTAVLALGAIFVYAIGKNIIKNKSLSLAFAASFLLSPAVQYTNLYDFHAVTLATTFLLAAFYFLTTKKYLWCTVFLVLAGTTKEQVWIITALMGLYIFFTSLLGAKRLSNPTRSKIASLISFARQDKEKLLGIIVFLVSITMFYFLIWHTIPAARGSQHFALSYYSDFGESPTNIVKNVFLSPQKTFQTFFQKDQLSYLTQLFLPLGFLSFLSPQYLIFALPDILINTLSGNSKLHQIYYQYSAAITPFIFISTIFGVRNLKVWFPKIPYLVLTSYFLLLTSYSAYSYGPLPFAKKSNIAMFTEPQKNRIEIENFMSTIPDHYSVAATNNMGSHLSQRQKIFTIPKGVSQADIIIFLMNSRNDRDAFQDLIKTIDMDTHYKQVLKIDESFIVFEKQVVP